ncbi:RING-H2 finger protein ATL2 [Rhynchospora pubera]|uniref:RING-type E3 ubiquitin transferase n=1 Tax=Rhynchospora pubera TaxID=906938 RepID=A0AAV8EBV0_9POAL|nr:RING-H2 finger protein ATL2 [Rhynchospora pubera]KAJ4775980.1 RING-H2 finger protein ATL2 [Rhynchospora pubera]
MTIAYRFLFTVHDDIQNNTSLTLDNSTTSPAAAPHWLASSHWHSHLLSGLLVALNILLVLLLFICFCKFFFRKHAPSSDNINHNNDSSADSSPLSSPRANAARALQLQVLSSLPVLEFRCSGVGKAEECAVCLAEFKDGDKARVLPRCQHHFHVDCIDTWFQSHANCPLCRNPVEESTGAGSESVV